jgi:hypothetical protein
MKHNSKQARASKKERASTPLFERIQLDAAGIDCGQNSHFVAVPPERDRQPVREFRTFTGELERLADWLLECEVKTVALLMFSLSVFHVLSSRFSRSTPAPSSTSRRLQQRRRERISRYLDRREVPSFPTEAIPRKLL